MAFKDSVSRCGVFNFKKYNSIRVVAFVGALVFFWQCIMFCLMFADTAMYEGKNIFLIIWYRWFQYFTIQSNIIVGVYQVWYWINPKQKCLNGNFMIRATAYITITFTLFSCILFPAMIVTQYQINTWDTPIWIVNMLQHFVTPTIALLFFGLYFRDCKNDFHVQFNKKEYWTFVGKSLIYPCFYVVYGMLIPFMSGHNVSIYGQFTNLDPKLIIDGMPGSPLALAVFFGAIVIFFIVLCIYKLAFRKINNTTIICQKSC